VAAIEARLELFDTFQEFVGEKIEHLNRDHAALRELFEQRGSAQREVLQSKSSHDESMSKGTNLQHLVVEGSEHELGTKFQNALAHLEREHPAVEQIGIGWNDTESVDLKSRGMGENTMDDGIVHVEPVALQDLLYQGPRSREERLTAFACDSAKFRSGREELEDSRIKLEKEHFALEHRLEERWSSNVGRDMSGNALPTFLDVKSEEQDDKDRWKETFMAELADAVKRLESEHAALRVWVDERLLSRSILGQADDSMKDVVGPSNMNFQTLDIALREEINSLRDLFQKEIVSREKQWSGVGEDLQKLRVYMLDAGLAIQQLKEDQDILQFTLTERWASDGRPLEGSTVHMQHEATQHIACGAGESV